MTAPSESRTLVETARYYAELNWKACRSLNPQPHDICEACEEAGNWDVAADALERAEAVEAERDALRKPARILASLVVEEFGKTHLPLSDPDATLEDALVATALEVRAALTAPSSEETPTPAPTREQMIAATPTGSYDGDLAFDDGPPAPTGGSE